jgi:TonB family protein
LKNTITAISIALLLLSGCSGIHEVAAPTEHVELISITPLPPMPQGSYKTEIRFNVLVHIQQDGTVENARMLGSSGYAEWDSLALQRIKQWRYAPFHRDGAPVDLWFRQQITVRIQKPIVMTIGELVSSSLHEADSLYALLEEGTDLDSLFQRTIGTFDIGTYPQRVRDELKRLDPGDFTSPLRRGEEYVIYKRFIEGTFEKESAGGTRRE